MRTPWKVPRNSTGICLVLLVLAFPALAQAPSASAPELKVGDEWRFTGGAVAKVVAIEGDTVVTSFTPSSVCPDCRFYRDKNLTTTKVVDRDGKGVDDPSLSFKSLDFPLEIGKKWTSNQLLRQRSTGALRPYDNALQVEAYEEVRTKAGTFKAFRIGWTQEYRGAGPGWIGRATYWYSPEVKWFIKRAVHTSNWRIPEFELESYTLNLLPPGQAQDSTPPSVPSVLPLPR